MSRLAFEPFVKDVFVIYYISSYDLFYYTVASRYSNNLQGYPIINIDIKVRTVVATQRQMLQRL